MKKNKRRALEQMAIQRSAISCVLGALCVWGFRIAPVTAVTCLVSSCPGSSGSESPASGVPVTFGCYSNSYSGHQFQAIGCGISPTLGSLVLDQLAQQEYAIQSQFWDGIPASVYAFNECSTGNAISLPSGVILFGTTLAHNLIIQTGSTLPLAGVLAHEWAHQVQFRFGWYDTSSPSVRNSELEADAFSGFYVGIEKAWAGSQWNAYLQSLFSLGDYNFNHMQHHGTPNMRLAAGLIGLMYAQIAAGSSTPLTYADLHAAFISGIEDIVACDGFCSDPLGISGYGNDQFVVLWLSGRRGFVDGIAGLSPTQRGFVHDVAHGRRSVVEFAAANELPADRTIIYPVIGN